MIEKFAANADEMILAFLQAEIESPRYRDLYASALAGMHADKNDLVTNADLLDGQQNAARRSVLGAVRGYDRDSLLFGSFPAEVIWRWVSVSPAEIAKFKYANHPVWILLSKGTRLVADGAANLDKVKTGEDTRANVAGILERLRRGERLAALIAVQDSGSNVSARSSAL